MKDFIENVRIALIKWNVAPLGVVVALCWVIYQLVIYMKKGLITDISGIDPMVAAAYVGGVLTLLGTACGFLYKMYDRMQRNNRGDESDDSDDQ